MDAFEPIRSAAAALHQALVAKGADPLKPLALVGAAAADLDLELVWLPAGDPAQEVGGVMLTLATLCTASGIDLENAAVTELGRVWQKVDTIRAKQATKPHASPLPGTGAAA